MSIGKGAARKRLVPYSMYSFKKETVTVQGGGFTLYGS